MAASRGFRASVEKHDALFTLLGALIVFVAFFVKEQVQETAKDLASSLNTAKAGFAVQKALSDITDQIAEIRDEQADLPPISHPFITGVSVGLVVVVGEGRRAMARLPSRASLNSWGVR
jgi:hypothetical protein